MMIASSRSARRAVLTMVLAAGLGLGAPAFADTRVGNDAYIRGDYETALREFTRAAERGDALAQFNLGGLYFEGRGAGPQRDYPEAARWFRAAAEQGLPNAQFNLAVLHYRGEGVNRDYPEMIKWMRLAADQQFAPALFQMGVIYENAIGVEANNAESLRWYRRAHGAGHPRAQAKIEGILAKTGIAYADQVDGQTAAAAARSDPRGNEALGGVPTFLESLPPARRAVASAPAAASPAPAPTTAPATAAPPARPAPAPAAAPVIAAAPPATRPPPPPPPPAPVTTAPVISAPAPVAQPSPAPAPVAAASPSAPARAAAAAPTGQWLVQLASLPNEAQARKSWAEMKASLSPVLGRFDATFRTVDLGARGVFTRVYVGPFSGRDQANALCADLRQQAPKQGCIPTPPGS